MAATVNVHEAKTHLSRLLERAHNGEEIVLAKAGKPYARLVPLADVEKPQRKPGRLKGMKIPDSFFDPLPEEELRLWEEGSPSDPLYRK
jgi:prevent-host-death family protein